MTEPQTTCYQAYRPPPRAAIQPTRPYIKRPHPRSPLWKTWNLDDVPPRPPRPQLPLRMGAAGSPWIYNLPGVGVDKLRNVKPTATDLVGNNSEGWTAEESLALLSNSDLDGEPNHASPAKETNTSEDLAVLSPLDENTEESEDTEMHSDSDSEGSDEPISTYALSRIVETEELEAASLDYGMSESQISPDETYQSLWGEVSFTDSSHRQVEDNETFLPDPISGDTSSDDSWPFDDEDDSDSEYSNSSPEIALPMLLYPLEQNIHFHFRFPGWHQDTRPSALWSPRYLNNLYYNRMKPRLCFCTGRGRRA